MRVTIRDDFSLKKIEESGQCFRVREFPENSSYGSTFRFVFRNHILYIRQVSPEAYEVSCSQEEWESTWFSYFDLERNYTAIRQLIPEKDIYLRTAAQEAAGVRILRQDPWEMLLTFIISQRKSIPAIKKNVEQLSKCFGTRVSTAYEDLWLFPTAEQIVRLSEENPGLLESCRLGYRLPYLKDAVWKVFSGELKPDELCSLSDGELFERLKTVKGVGDKVANCVCLFGYHRTTNAPVDVWIRRAIDEHYEGINPFPSYGENAGIMQQFLFYYAQFMKN